MDKLAVIGGGGHGRVVADLARVLGWEPIIYDDAHPLIWRGSVISVGAIQDVEVVPSLRVLLGIGDNIKRSEIFKAFVQSNVSLPCLIHPSVICASQVEIGLGTVLLPGSIIHTGAAVGAGCIVNIGATIDHDCILDDFVHVSSGSNLAGGVVVGEGAWIGANAVVRQGVRIGPGAVVGAGAVVVRDVLTETTVVGNPARAL